MWNFNIYGGTYTIYSRNIAPILGYQKGKEESEPW